MLVKCDTILIYYVLTTTRAPRSLIRSRPSERATPTLRAKNFGDNGRSGAASGNNHNDHSDHGDHNNHDGLDGLDETMSASMASGATASTAGRSARLNANTYGSTAVANGVCSVLVLARSKVGRYWLELGPILSSITTRHYQHIFRFRPGL